MKKIKTNDLIDIINSINNDKNLLNSFLTDLLTPAEYTEIKKRWEIVKMLNEGINQHQISKSLHVGIATVTRGSRAIKDSKGGFKKVLNQKDHLN